MSCFECYKSSCFECYATKFLSNLAAVAYQFTLPVINDVSRRTHFDHILQLATEADGRFSSLMRPETVDDLRPGTHASARKFLLLAEQLSTEAGVVRRVMLEPESLAKEKIQDVEDTRLGWFTGRP